MSNRTLMEFNHDYWANIDRDPEGFADLILRVLSGRDADAIEELRDFGVTVGRMRHHSDDMKGELLAAFGGKTP